jgi:hypothetical protein
MKATIKLSDKAREVLSRSTITATSVKLPEQLDRALYTELAKVFALCGGKWRRSTSLHVFDRDPREALGLAVAAGEILDEKRALQFFETPSVVAEELVELLRLKVHSFGLEPSAGRGAIGRVLSSRLGAHHVDAVEIHPPFAAELRASECYRSVLEGDFLQQTRLTMPTYNVIAMNPPFHGGADVDHILHAWGFLQPGGRLTAVTSPAWTFREGAKWDHFRTLLKAHGTFERELPEGTFRESGTNIRTKIIRLEAPT